MSEKIIWTIGHSTHSSDQFIRLLLAYRIAQLADIRLLPGSKRYPQFNQDALETLLAEHGIHYFHLKALGGRRRPLKHSKNTAWRVEAFRGYADYMETQAFKTAIGQLEELAAMKRTVYMCSEAVWWSCHRALVSDYLKAEGWTVLHIMSETKAEEHPYTRAAKLVNGQLSYTETDLFSE